MPLIGMILVGENKSRQNCLCSSFSNWLCNNMYVRICIYLYQRRI